MDRQTKRQAHVLTDRHRHADIQINNKNTNTYANKERKRERERGRPLSQTTNAREQLKPHQKNRTHNSSPNTEPTRSAHETVKQSNYLQPNKQASKQPNKQAKTKQTKQSRTHPHSQTILWTG